MKFKNKKLIKKLAVCAAALVMLAPAGADLSSEASNQPQTVVAARRKMRVARKSYAYNSRGRRKGKLGSGKTVTIYGTKWIHGRKYYRIGHNKYVRASSLKSIRKRRRRVSRKRVRKTSRRSRKTNRSKNKKSRKPVRPVRPTKPAKPVTPSKPVQPANPGNSGSSSSTQYAEDRITLPADYTRAALTASENSPTDAILSASTEGLETNQFTPESKADDEESVDIHNLTSAQKSEISNFALRLINEGRSQMGSTPWHYTSGAQALADDVANEYQNNGRGVQDGQHYVAGLSRAAAKHGYNINGMNQIEDMYGDTSDEPKTMTDLKQLVYSGILQFLFNGQEYHHACDIMGTHQLGYWNNYTSHCPFAVSFSRVGGWNSVHFISIPSNI